VERAKLLEAQARRKEAERLAERRDRLARELETAECAMCLDGECTDGNLIVACEGDCGVFVHQECYGLPSQG